ncbi:Maleamate amidohydrolase [Lachnellula hyalina]|uniref:Maleamate amidohydrolase n=1 Tax=Lachnellula hyalina TaxID=1316788 RepID=A0A8H8R8E2_9HELO|nr:Maleamate amidohydrolase [Lachnellula hyalina]TVY29497.1 Maleamate amidohydrolase [Lachnellula hyalina]
MSCVDMTPETDSENSPKELCQGMTKYSQVALERARPVYWQGYSTSGCVRATALDAMQHGYSPFVVREACGDRYQAVNDNNLFDMDQKFAEVILEEEMLAMYPSL